MTLQACNLTSTTCCTNPVHAAVIRIACSAAATAQSEQQNKVEYMCMLVRVLMRSDTMEPVPGCVGNTALHKPLCSQKQHKTRWQQAVTVQPELQRSGIDVVPIPMGWTHQTDAAGCTWLDGMLHKPLHTAVFRTACRQRLLTN
jgi:hypothetical protein